jgi:two-component system, NarL family, nitrate/nitrite response regulator NarL
MCSGLHLKSRVMAKRTRIVIADDHTVLRESLAALLSSQRDFKVVGRASDGNEALELVRSERPEVLVLDLFMPGRDGFEVLRTLDTAGLHVASVVLTGSENQADHVQVIRLGARGLVLKGDDPQKLFTAIRTVANGDVAFGDDTAQAVLQAMSSDPLPSPGSLDRLSERERQIVEGVARGLKNRDIATEYGISENTVKRHLQSIFSKTGVRDRLELAVIALSGTANAA